MKYPPQPRHNFLGEETLIFLHLLKTGGRTLVSVLKENIANEYRFHYGQGAGEKLDDLKALPEDQRRSLRLIHGHLHYGIHTYLPQPSTYITLLRDPVERVISHYYYALHNPKHYTHEMVTKKGMSLADYVTCGITDLNNGQTRCIAGDRSHRLKFGESDTALLEAAKQHLNQHFLLAGVTERFDEFILLLRHQLNLRHILYTHSNVNAKRPKKDDISSHDIELIRHYNQLDIQLYEYVHETFQAHVEAMGHTLQQELILLKQFNAQYFDIQTDLEKVKSKFSQARIRSKRLKKSVRHLQASVQQQQEVINILMNSRRGKLWHIWMRIKKHLGKVMRI